MTEPRVRIFDEYLPLKPNLYPETDQFIEAIWQSFWTPAEFSFMTDYDDFKVLMTPEEQGVIVRTLSAISQVEVAVKRFWSKIGDNLPHPGIIDAGFALANSEVIHSRAYSKLLERLGLEHIFEENLKLPVVKGRVDYLRKYLKKFSDNHREQFVYSLILFTLFIENVSLFSQFYVVLWFNREKKLLKDASQQVKYTRNEESLHAEFGIYLINTIRQEYPELFNDKLLKRVVDETQVAFKTECSVIDWILGGYEGNGLSADILKSYIERRIDDSLGRIGFNKVFTDSPRREYDALTYWMDEEQYANNRVDFFNSRSVNYAKNNNSYDTDDMFNF